MDTIGKVYAAYNLSISEKEFREAVNKRIENMGGLADEETATMLVVHESTDNGNKSPRTIKRIENISAVNSSVEFTAKIESIGDLQKLETLGDDIPQLSVNMADGTGTIQSIFYDELALEVNSGEFELGDVLRVRGDINKKQTESVDKLVVDVTEAEIVENTLFNDGKSGSVADASETSYDNKIEVKGNKKNGPDISEGNSKNLQNKFEQKIDGVNTRLSQIDSLVTDAEYKRAEEQVDEVKSDISSLKRQVSQENLDTLETKLQRLEKKCDERLSKSNVLTQLREMDPTEFEKLVEKIWKKQGWDTKGTSGSTDRGVDVIATKKGAFEERRHLIQVKRHGESSRVGSEDIQRYAGLYARRDEKPDAVFVVTSNRFTKEAKEVAKNRDVRTVNCDELYEMLTET